MLEVDENSTNISESQTSSPIAKGQSSPNQSKLAYQQQQRIVQPNLVYIINIHQSLADEKVNITQILSQKQYFGQFGKIKKCKVKRHKPLHKNGLNAFSAHITYKSPLQAAQCIRATDKFTICGLALSVTFGTTKYCNHFLQKGKCPRKSCPFLHKFSNQEDTMSKDLVTQFHFVTPSNFRFNDEEYSIIPPDNKTSFLPSILKRPKRTYSQQLDAKPILKQRSRCNSESSPMVSRWGFAFTDDDEGNQIEIYEMFKQNLFVSRVQGSKIKEIFEKDTWMEEVLNVLYKKKPVNLKRVEEGDYDDCCLELIK